MGWGHRDCHMHMIFDLIDWVKGRVLWEPRGRVQRGCAESGRKAETGNKKDAGHFAGTGSRWRGRERAFHREVLGTLSKEACSDETGYMRAGDRSWWGRIRQRPDGNSIVWHSKALCLGDTGSFYSPLVNKCTNFSNMPCLQLIMNSDNAIFLKCLLF